MANSRIIDLPALGLQQLTDLYEVSDNGAGSFKETRAQLLSFMQTNITSSSQEVYVSNNGVDAVGRGGVNSPYLTLDYAISQITDNATKIYNIQVLSASTVPNLVLKPNVLLHFNGNPLTVTGSVTLDAGWVGGGSLLISNAKSLTLPAGVSLNFGTLSCPFAFVVFEDNLISSNSFITLTSFVLGQTVFFSNYNYGYLSQWSYGLNDCSGVISNGSCNSVLISRTSNVAGGDLELKSVTVLQNLEYICSNSSGTSFFLQSSRVLGLAQFISNSVGTLTVKSRGTSYASGSPLLSDGVLGGDVAFTSDFLDFLPNLVSGAQYLPTSLANAVKANYTPADYIPIDTSVTGHLEGIDSELGIITTALGNVVYLTGDQNIAGIKTFTDPTPSTNFSTGGTIVQGGFGCYQRGNFGNILTASYGFGLRTGQFFTTPVTGFTEYIGLTNLNLIGFYTNNALAMTLSGSKFLNTYGEGNLTSAIQSLANFGRNSIGGDTANFYSISITKFGIQSLILGINRTLTTTEVPSDCAFISTLTTGGPLSIGRGNGSLLPQTTDIYIGPTGTVNFPHTVTVIAQQTISTFDVTGAGTLYVIKPDLPVLDQNNNYNAVTGQVTCPVIGTYEVEYVILLNNVAPTIQDVNVQIVVNGIPKEVYRTGANQNALGLYTIAGSLKVRVSTPGWIIYVTVQASPGSQTIGVLAGTTLSVSLTA